jgi:actin-related protein
MGASGTVITPVVEGAVDSRGVRRSHIGGFSMDDHTMAMLQRRGVDPIPSYRLSKEGVMHGDETHDIIVKQRFLTGVTYSYDLFRKMEIIRDLRRSTSRLADTSSADDPRLGNLPTLPYELPDGTVVEIGPERFEAAELAFRPTTLLSPVAPLPAPTSEDHLQHQIAGTAQDEKPQNVSFSSTTRLPYSQAAVPDLAVEAVMALDSDLQHTLFSSLVLTGGASAFEELGNRMRSEVANTLLDQQLGYKVKNMSMPATDRANCNWLGGSIVASLGAFHEAWVSKAEYSEFGPGIVSRKCP